MRKNPSIAIVGASGAVGEEMLRVFERRQFPYKSLRLLASPRSAGKAMKCGDTQYTVEVLTPASFEGIDIALFSASGSVSKQYAHAAVRSGAVVIDNSSAFRMDSAVPLVIPEINPEDVKHHSGIIANPNCTTAIALMALHPLHKEFGLKTIIASSYQAVSGAGAKAIAELEEQVSALKHGHEIDREVFPHQIAFNVIPQVDHFLPDGYTREEMKLVNESRKILHLPNLRASATCVRVPVFRAHAVSIVAQFVNPVSVDKAREAIERAPGVALWDNPEEGRYPMPLDCSEQDDCRAGRIRLDSALENALSLWVCGDQLLKGAALNAVQIAELLIA